MGGHKSGHSEKIADSENLETTTEVEEIAGDIWWAVRDSNPRLPACKAGALTS